MNPTPNWRRFNFHGLPAFSRRQAAGWNVLNRIVATGAGWQKWIAEGLADLLEMPAGVEIRLRQRHTMDPQRAEALFESTAREITLGRDESCDIRLALRSVGNCHARIFTRDGRCYLEDLGSALGTFLNESRLTASQPAPVHTGDQFAIFPYTFSLELTERWVRGTAVEVSAGTLSPLNGAAFGTSVAADCLHLGIQLQPIGAMFALEVGRSFLDRLSARLAAPLYPQAAERLGQTAVDTGCLEFLIAAVLERINHDLRFPLQATLVSPSAPCANRVDERGLILSFVIRIAELTGAFRLWIPDGAIDSLAHLPAPRTLAIMPEVAWVFLFSAGYVELTATEAALIEPSDVVLLTREMAMLFPNAPERGWRLSRGAGNLSQATIDKYFERVCLTETRNDGEGMTTAATRPDLASLPIRLHAIIGEKEMTLAEANLLVAGGIIEFDSTTPEPVRIALNGKIAGTGELVEVDGRLGVRILAWRAP